MLKEIRTSVELKAGLNSDGYGRYVVYAKAYIISDRYRVGSPAELALRCLMSEMSSDVLGTRLTRWDPARVEYSYSPARRVLTRTERGWYHGWHQMLFPIPCLPGPSLDLSPLPSVQREDIWEAIPGWSKLEQGEEL